ncbi:CocE/NonD family hydrolase [Nocardia concava]|uniref:CocE/NonD family hydrolase n=1 Tax=Nocardia concava TaxID=257281 RepID=UPI0002DF1B8D|nr:CocE/NonD family hydrolase [Nocardia concava]
MTGSIRRRVRCAAAVVAVGLLGVAAASAPALADEPAATAPATPDPAAVDPAYLLQNMAMLLQGYQHDWANPAEFQYWIAHLTSLPGRAFADLAPMLDPGQYQGPDGQQKLRDNIEKVLDESIRQFPTVLGAQPIPANRLFLPNWSHSGVFGDPADNTLDGDSLTNSPGNVGITGAFRYPCILPDDTVLYETRSGDCVSADTPGADFKLGQARKIQIVNARGLRLAATLWLPEDALQPNPGHRFPMTVFTNGAAVPQSSYYAYTMTAVRHGYIGLTYDEAGQGASDGTVLDEVVPYNTPHCFASGPCRDVEDVVRWVVGDDIIPSSDTQTLLGDTSNLVDFWNTVHIPRLGQRYNPAYAPAGANDRNPVLDLIDTDQVGLMAQSMGSIATSHYLYDIGEGHGMDGRPLPKPAAAVLMSGFEPSFGNVPTQIQTADTDIPGMTAGGAFPINDFNLGGAHIGFDPTDGPLGGKSWYDWVRGNARGNAPLQFLVLKGGSHGDTSNIDMVTPRAVGSWAASTHFAVDWLDCNILKDTDACTRATSPDANLSEATAAEVSPEGAAGPSYCMTTPTRNDVETVLFTPLKSLLSRLYGEPDPQLCVPAGTLIPFTP